MLEYLAAKKAHEGTEEVQEMAQPVERLTEVESYLVNKLDRKFAQRCASCGQSIPTIKDLQRMKTDLEGGENQCIVKDVTGHPIGRTIVMLVLPSKGKPLKKTIVEAGTEGK